MASALSRLLDPSPERVVPTTFDSSFRWATVVGTDPLTIQLDGDTDPLPLTPDSLEPGLAVDQRVWTQLYNRRVVVLGSAASRAPLGEVAYAEITSAGSGTTSTTPVDVAGLSVTVPMSSLRKYKATVVMHPRSSVSNDRVAITLDEGGTILQQFVTPQLAATNSGHAMTLVYRKAAPTDGDHTWKVQIHRFSGSGTAIPGAGAGAPAFLLVEDIGRV